MTEVDRALAEATFQVEETANCEAGADFQPILDGHTVSMEAKEQFLRSRILEVSCVPKVVARLEQGSSSIAISGSLISVSVGKGNITNGAYFITDNGTFASTKPLAFFALYKPEAGFSAVLEDGQQVSVQLFNDNDTSRVQLASMEDIFDRLAPLSNILSSESECVKFLCILHMAAVNLKMFIWEEEVSKLRYRNEQLEQHNAGP